MAIRGIKYENDEILRKKSKSVDKYDSKIKILIDDMIETMKVNEGAGLAAVQVGILKRIIVADIGNGPIVIINPEITFTEGTQVCEEGCLSLPNQFYKVKRPQHIIVEGLDENFQKIKVDAKDLLAVVLSHEIDHLDGVLFIDKLYEGEK